jgi:predicted TIM-barrel fold metal-dependent hydrolase
LLTDAHVHIFPPQFIEQRQKLAQEEPYFALLYANPASPMAAGPQLLRHLDEAHIGRAWVVGFSWQQEANAQIHNDYLRALAQEFPDRLRWLAGMWPAAPWALAEARRALAGGGHGLGELAFYDRDLILPPLHRLCRLCQEYDVPLMLHVNEPVGGNYPGKAPMGLSRSYEFLRVNPKGKIILAHLGGGIFFYKLLKSPQTRRVMDNVWLDLAASPYLYQPQALRLAVQLMGAEKILTGSDYPLLTLARTQDLLCQAGLSPEDFAMVSGQAANRLIA